MNDMRVRATTATLMRASSGAGTRSSDGMGLENGRIMKARHALIVLVGLITLCSVSLGASSDALDEIVVTAQRRAERLQDVPAAITALSGDSLNQLRMQGNADLAAHVPRLSFDVLGPGESTLAIRGLSTAYGLAPAVSYYINETPLDIRTDGFSGAPD